MEQPPVPHRSEHGSGRVGKSEIPLWPERDNALSGRAVAALSGGFVATRASVFLHSTHRGQGQGRRWSGRNTETDYQPRWGNGR